MSQKKLKRLRRQNLVSNSEKETEVVFGIRQIIRKNWKFLLLLCLGIITIYFNSLWGAFVSDDYATIPQNTQITDIKSTFKAGFFVNIIKTSTALVFGVENPIPYHVVNLILYLLVCVVSFVFLKLFFDDLVSKIALVIFAVLPIHVEAVSWISGLPYLVSSLLILASLSFLVLFLKTGKKKYIWWLFVFTLMSLFADRIRWFGFVLLAILTIASFKDKLKVKVNLLKLISWLTVLMVVLMIFFSPMIKERISSVNSGINVSESIFYNPFFQYPTAIAKYLQLILVPTDLTLYHTMYVLPIWLNWAILLTYLVSVTYFFFKDKKIFFALAFIFLATASSMAPVKVSWLVAERYVFLGSLGVALLLALIVEKFWNKKILMISLLSFLVVIYSVRVVYRNIDWQTNHNLWVNTCQVSPNSHNAWNNIGDDYDKLASNETTDEGKMSQYLNAIKGFGQSFVIKPNYADAYHNQANIFYKIGRLDLARQGYETALGYNPRLDTTLKTLIQLDLMEGNKVELKKHLNSWLALAPNDLSLNYQVAVVYGQAGMVSEAKEIADELYKYYPNITEIKNLYDGLNQLNASGSAVVNKINN